MPGMVGQIWTGKDSGKPPGLSGACGRWLLVLPGRLPLMPLMFVTWEMPGFRLCQVAARTPEACPPIRQGCQQEAVARRGGRDPVKGGAAKSRTKATQEKGRSSLPVPGAFWSAFPLLLLGRQARGAAPHEKSPRGTGTPSCMGTEARTAFCLGSHSSYVTVAHGEREDLSRLEDALGGVSLPSL